MNKRFFLLIIISALSFPSFSQTLFTYGQYAVQADEFVKAYNKNNTAPAANKEKAMRDYLNLYINSRLKIREALERRYDTLPQITVEVTNLRNQIIENFMSDPQTMTRLTQEAFARSQKDIHVAHIFIAANNNDTAAAFNQANSIYERLQKGEDFAALAQQFSQDPAAKTNKGDMGWITAFTLPYVFENAVYATAPGKYSTITRSKAGYHIFKNIAERKAVGKMKAKQILLAFPPGSDASAQQKIAKKADSIYKRLLAGESFDKLATAFSNDYTTAITGGTMPDFGVGQYDPAFEAKVWGLAKDGAITKPFLTSHGYHIVKRTGIVAVVTDANNKSNEQELRQKINRDQRWKESREVIYNNVKTKAGFQPGAYDKNHLWAYTDSLLDRRPLGAGKNINPDGKVFTLGDTAVKVSDWITYAQAFRYKPDGSGRKTYEEVMTDHVNAVVMQYYRDHLELFNVDFRNQMNEFKEGNLFFEIMQQEIWNRTGTDTLEQKALYEANKTKYNWSKSADAVIFFCSDKETAELLFNQVKKNPANWKTYTDALVEKVVADSSRYEWPQLPSKTKIVPYTGLVTTPLINPTDNTASFAYISKVYPQPAQRTFNEAKGLVINDYQALLEEQWIKRLREKYPVKVDEKVLENLLK